MRIPQRLLSRAARPIFIGATLVYCGAVLVLALLWATIERRVWWLELTDVFAIFFFAPLLLLVPAAWRVRSRMLRGAVAALILLFLFQFGPQSIPMPGGSQAARPRLRIATFNLHYALTETRLAEIIAAIRLQRPDVVALQELSEPAAAVIRKTLIGEYPYQALTPAASYTGMGLISRYPLELLSAAQPAPGQVALLRVDGEAVTLINVSLIAPEIKMRRLPLLRSVKVIRGYQTNKRSRQIAALVRLIDEARGPVVVAGDFNLSDREPDYAQFAARLHDAYRETNWGFGYTFPTGPIGPLPFSFPLIRIDYIWSGGGVAPVAARVECASGSDHCISLADLAIEPAVG